MSGEISLTPGPTEVFLALFKRSLIISRGFVTFKCNARESVSFEIIVTKNSKLKN